MGAAAAEQRGGVGRRRDPAQFVSQQHHDRQGANAPAVVRLAIGPLPRRLRLFRRRRRRVDNRPRLGRPGRDLRVGQRIGRDRAVLGNARDGDRRCRSRAHSPGADAHQQLRRLRARRGRDGHVVSHHRFRLRGARGKAHPAPQCRALPICAGRPGDAGRQLLRGLQHPGPGLGAAAQGDRAQKTGDRRLRRARIRPRR